MAGSRHRRSWWVREPLGTRLAPKISRDVAERVGVTDGEVVEAPLYACIPADGEVRLVPGDIEGAAMNDNRCADAHLRLHAPAAPWPGRSHQPWIGTVARTDRCGESSYMKSSRSTTWTHFGQLRAKGMARGQTESGVNGSWLPGTREERWIRTGVGSKYLCQSLPKVLGWVGIVKDVTHA